MLSIFIPILFVSTITYGATTIGNNITSGGNLTNTGTVTVYGATSIGGAITATSTLNVTGLTTLTNASTTQLSITGNLWINGFATTTSLGNINGQGILTMLGTGTSTFSGGIQSTALNITSATASSTFANGIILSKGCFLMPDGTCAGAGGGSGTINSGTTGQLSYYAGSGTTLTATSSLFIHSNQNIGIGTTTPNWLLQVAGTRPFFTLSDTGAAANNKHWFLSSQGGNFYIGTSSDALATSTVSALTINSNGNVGIATSSPSSGLFSIENIGTGHTFYATDSANDTTPFVIDASGNVGIGKIPNASLQIESSATEKIRLSGTSQSESLNQYASISFSESGENSLTIATHYDGVNNAIIFSPRNVESMRLLGSGKVGLGTTTPNWKLQVASSSPQGASFALSDMTAGSNLKHWLISNQSGNLYFATSSDAYATSTSNLLNLISSNYSVGIGTTSPAEQLSISGRLFVGGTGTSTIQNNLYVMGTLRSTVSYVGDLIFSNNFRFIESQSNEKTQSLFLNNQNGENLFKIDENGNLSVKKIEAERGRFRDEIETKNIKIGSPQDRTGITIYDEKTGKPYCLKINDGKVINKEGECK